MMDDTEARLVRLETQLGALDAAIERLTENLQWLTRAIFGLAFSMLVMVGGAAIVAGVVG
ncbi:MAG: hypothetical protein D6683_02790 [Actinomyces sp.]|nr:MAG: hypothetical protein D6683_02790 [Actinomyces sp.]